MAYYVVSPASVLGAWAPSLLNYAGQQLSLVTILWSLVLTEILAFTGTPLIQQRQNLSTKFRVLGWLGLAGILIEGTVSAYLFSNSSDAITSRTTASTVAFKLVERTVPYSVVFAATVLVGYGIGRSQTSTATPPPRFGRK
jgi:hypothetical protein